MKTIVFILLMISCYEFIYAHETRKPTITVYGKATTEVIPNTLNWSLSVRNQGSDLTKVAKHHSVLVARVLSLLQQQGIAKKDIQTAQMQFGERRENFEHTTVDRYYSSTSISFSLSDLKRYQPIWLKLASISSVSVNQISYDHTDRINYQNSTRKQALIAAKQKAENLASTYGSSIGAPLEIEETPPNVPLPYSNRLQYSGNETPGSGDIALGNISISMQVRVVFDLINK